MATKPRVLLVHVTPRTSWGVSGPTPQRTRDFDYHLSNEQRRTCIAVYFVDALGAPGKGDLDGVDGTTPIIQRELNVPAGSRDLIKRVLTKIPPSTNAKSVETWYALLCLIDLEPQNFSAQTDSIYEIRIVALGIQTAWVFCSSRSPSSRGWTR